MNKPAKPAIRSKALHQKIDKVTTSEPVAAEQISSPKTVDTLTEIAERSSRLFRLYAERLASDDGYQVIDPRTVAATFQQFAQKAAADPASIAKEQFALWGDLALLWQRTASRILFNAQVEPVIEPAQQDKRFKNEAWVANPFFDYMKQYYLLMSRYLQSSVGGVKGLDPHAHHQAQFYTRQFVNAVSPTNFAATNPAVVDATIESGGENLINGLRNLLEDLERGGGRLSLKMTDLAAFKFGENIAASPGKVIFQNELMQLLQYAPSTPEVHRRPLLIVPPWINKFYILDLKPKNSFIKWCTDQGHTVFVISWVNPGAELADKGFTDYQLEGPMAALDAIKRATGEAEANVVGYCIGGTLTASALAYMTATNDRRVASAVPVSEEEPPAGPRPRGAKFRCPPGRSKSTALGSGTAGAFSHLSAIEIPTRKILQCNPW
jgi:polyhydroxyalkanoate synthase subunit PhaC